MKAGDSLTEKVFEAIGNCDFFIVILSSISIKKQWVKEELNAALMQKIKGKLKLIPIPIDADADIPISIDHLYRFNIADTDNYEKVYQELVMDIWGISKKPPLGKKPSFVLDYKIQGLNDLDSIILKKIGDEINKNHFYDKIRFEKLSELINEYGLSDEQILESIEVLESNGFLEKTQFIGSKTNVSVKITSSGFLFYAENFWDDFDERYLSVISSIINKDLMQSNLIHKETNMSKSFIIAILINLDQKNFVKINKTVMGVAIYKITGNGKRFMKKILE